MKSHAAAGRGTADTAAGVQTAKTWSVGIPTNRNGDVGELNSAVYVSPVPGSQTLLPVLPKANNEPHDSAVGVNIKAPPKEALLVSSQTAPMPFIR